MKMFLGVLLMSVFQLGCSVFGVRSEENPKYRVIQKSENKEIREYAPYIVATTTVEGSFDGSQNEAFRILAGYIFGKNEKKQKIAMTSPVLQEPNAKAKESEKIAMTAPVVQSPTSGGWQMTFMMPSKYKLEDLPRPLDNRVSLQEVPAKTIAAIEFSGFWSEKKNKKKADELTQWLAQMPQYKPSSEPKFAGYDPPWTLPFLRRNEIMIELSKK